MVMRAKVPSPLRLDGNYKIVGKVLVLPIQGEGLCSLRLGKVGRGESQPRRYTGRPSSWRCLMLSCRVPDDVTADINIVMHEVTRGGVKFLAVDKLSLSFDTSRLHMKFDNLFNGNRELGKDTSPCYDS